MVSSMFVRGFRVRTGEGEGEGGGTEETRKKREICWVARVIVAVLLWEGECDGFGCLYILLWSWSWEGEYVRTGISEGEVALFSLP